MEGLFYLIQLTILIKKHRKSTGLKLRNIHLVLKKHNFESDLIELVKTIEFKKIQNNIQQ